MAAVGGDSLLGRVIGNTCPREVHLFLRAQGSGTTGESAGRGVGGGVVSGGPTVRTLTPIAGSLNSGHVPIRYFNRSDFLL